MKNDFKILKEGCLFNLQVEIEKLLDKGYSLEGPIQFVNYCYVQYMKKQDFRYDDKCICSSLLMQKNCMALTECQVRVYLNKQTETKERNEE